MFDCIIKNGNVIDGCGMRAFKTDVGIKGDRISVIGDLSRGHSKETIDATGLVVAPGFIDLHTHSDYTLLADPRAESQIHQGVTMELIGNCGVSMAPISKSDDLHEAFFLGRGSVEVTWKSFAEYLARLEEAQPGINVASCVGHRALRAIVMNKEPRPATIDEVGRMARLLDEALEQGGFGFSTGLEYYPSKETWTDELLDLCKVTAKYNGLYATHVRNRDVFYDLAFTEALSLARNSNARLEISHINPKFGRPDSAMANTLKLIEWARKDGVDVGIDVMPSNWNYMFMLNFLPSWALEHGPAGALKFLSDQMIRPKLKHDPKPIWQAVARGEWERIRLFDSEANKKYLGMTIGEIARDRNIAPYDAVFDLLIEEGAGAARLRCIGDNFSEEDIRLAMTDHYCSIISDTAALALDGPLANIKIAPFSYNWVSRFFQKYIREQKILTLEEGVRRVTSLPASRINIHDRGILRSGAMADITIFDDETIADNSSIANPNQYPSGIEHVIVNGNIAIRNRKRLPVNAGRVLRRG